jgi:hypothetical protein
MRNILPAPSRRLNWFRWVLKCCSDRKCSGYILEVLREYSHHSCGRRLWLAKFLPIFLNNWRTFCHCITSSIHLNQFTHPEEGCSMLLLQHWTFDHYLVYRPKIWLSLQLLKKHTRTTPDTKQTIPNNYRVASTGLNKPVILHGTSIHIHWCLY